jgi:hypothetical protein
VTFARPQPHRFGRALFFKRKVVAAKDDSREAPAPGFRRRNRTQSLPLYFHCFHCSSHCFSIATHCSCAGAVSLVPARPCIANGSHFPLQIACIFIWQVVVEIELSALRPSSELPRGQKCSADRDIGRTRACIGFVLRKAENGCIELDVASFDRIDG